MTALTRLPSLQDDVERAAVRHHAGNRRLRDLLVLLDAVAVGAAWAVVLLTDRAPAALVDAAAVAVLVPLWLVLASWQKLYLARVCAMRAVEVSRVARVAALTSGAALLLERIGAEVSGPAALAGGALSFVGSSMARSGYGLWLEHARKSGRYRRDVIVIGSNEEAASLVGIIRTHPELGLAVLGVIGPEVDYHQQRFDVRHLGSAAAALEIIERSGVNGVIIAASALRPAELNWLSRALVHRGVHVHLSSGLRGISHTRLRAQPLAHEPLFYLEPLRLAPWQLRTKRVIDVVLSAAALAVAAPVLALAALAVKLQDRGPVLFRQQRVGKGCQPFTILKLRTMDVDAEHRYVTLADANAGRDGPLIKLRSDPRVTPVGRFLRATSIDELPQLWNVLRGTMSLVGPRPAQASEVAAFDAELLSRQDVPPGITGLWQVEARDNPSFEAYRRYDLFYIENWSTMLDLAILLGTVQTVVIRALAFVLHTLPRRRTGATVSPLVLD